MKFSRQRHDVTREPLNPAHLCCAEGRSRLTLPPTDCRDLRTPTSFLSFGVSLCVYSLRMLGGCTPATAKVSSPPPCSPGAGGWRGMEVGGLLLTRAAGLWKQSIIHTPQLPHFVKVVGAILLMLRDRGHRWGVPRP